MITGVRYAFYSTTIFTVITVCISCAEQKAGNTIKFIKYGSSFGMCRGYCYTEIIFEKGRTINYKSAQGGRQQDNIPDQRDTLQTSKGQWDTLAGMINLHAFYNLADTIGCPDCADGGAEWVEIGAGNKSHRVFFEYGTDLKPVRSLLKFVRRKD